MRPRVQSKLGGIRTSFSTGVRLRQRWQLLRMKCRTPGTYCLIGTNVLVWGSYNMAPAFPRKQSMSSQWLQSWLPSAAPRKHNVFTQWLQSWLPTKQFWDRHFFSSYSTVVRQHRLETVPLCTFMHADGYHLLFNMVTLFFFGRQLEQLLGLGRFWILYAASGTMAAASQVAACGRQEPRTMVCGASGGIFAVLAFTTCLMPHQKVLLYMVIPVPLWLLMAGLVAADVVMVKPKEGVVGHIVGAGCGAAFFALRYRRWWR